MVEGLICNQVVGSSSLPTSFLGGIYHMGCRTHISRTIKNNRVELNFLIWTQLTTWTPGVTYRLVSPIKLFLPSSYIGDMVYIGISNNDAYTIREVFPGELHFFDEVDDPSKLYIKPSDSIGGQYLYWRCGIELV